MPPDATRRITRTGHKKSRHGCLRCKLRHVKVPSYSRKKEGPNTKRIETDCLVTQCDEQQPCHNCTKHNVECSLVQNTRTKFPRAISANLVSETGCIESSDISARPPSVNYCQELSSLSSKASRIKNIAIELENEIKSRAHEPRADNAHVSPPSKAVSPDWMKSLQLLNHYYASTCLTLNHDDATLHMWRTVVPELAVSHVSGLCQGLPVC